MRALLAHFFHIIAFNLIFMPIAKIIRFYCTCYALVTDTDGVKKFNEFVPLFEKLSNVFTKTYDLIDGESNAYEINRNKWKQYKYFNN